MKELPRHDPVLPHAVLESLAPQRGETVLDVTLGLGGHAKLFLQKIGEQGKLIGLDADEENIALARDRLKEHMNARFLHANFRDIASLDLPVVDILFADLGVSSPHLDDVSRGFTFREEAPLDLRFDRSQGKTAEEWIGSADERAIARALKDFGELPSALHLARALKERRPTTTTAVVLTAEAVYRWRAKSFLSQIFQALRIAVNEELGALDALLAHGPSLLSPGGRMGIISYHSLEDRRVKQAFRALTTPVKNEQTGAVQEPAKFSLLLRKAVVPPDSEMEANPRARSAKFRALKRNDS